jgi:hypothetical protein
LFLYPTQHLDELDSDEIGGLQMAACGREMMSLSSWLSLMVEAVMV